MKIKVNDIVEVDESKYPHLTSKQIRDIVQANFAHAMQYCEDQCRIELEDTNFRNKGYVKNEQ